VDGFRNQETDDIQDYNMMMNYSISPDKRTMGLLAAEKAGSAMQQAIAEKGNASIIVATGASQFDMLEALVSTPGIDWAKITGFHLDEYVGLPPSHPASFRKYLKERFVDRLPNLKAFHYVNGDMDPPEAECARLGELIASHTIDVACIGIGENGHIAFNDPPADFETTSPYIVVELDEACRQQQLGEGWFPSIEAVPSRAISMGVKQIMKSKCIVCTVPDERKANAVYNSMTGPIRPEVPAGILRQHRDCTLFLDTAAASKLPGNIR
jgi:glucosamine-6-phosphate deaminase